jgi:hypothetical protein
MLDVENPKIYSPFCIKANNFMVSVQYLLKCFSKFVAVACGNEVIGAKKIEKV